METRRYYNRYQKTMPSIVPRQQITIEQSTSDDCKTAVSLAMVYAPKQCFGELYDLNSALKNGTIFKELNKPFYGKRC